MSSPAERLARNTNLAAETPDRKEFEGLVRSGLARLSDAEKKGNSLDGRFDLAYNAAHALCLAALRSRLSIVETLRRVPSSPRYIRPRPDSVAHSGQGAQDAEPVGIRRGRRCRRESRPRHYQRL